MDDITALQQARQHVFALSVRTESLLAVYNAPEVTTDYQEPECISRVRLRLEAILCDTAELLKAYTFYLARCADQGVTLAQADTLWEQHAPATFDQELLQAAYTGGEPEQLIEGHILRHMA
jgi:hypothetical protein